MGKIVCLEVVIRERNDDLGELLCETTKKASSSQRCDQLFVYGNKLFNVNEPLLKKLTKSSLSPLEGIYVSNLW